MYSLNPFAFEAHVTDTVKAFLRQENTNLAVIPEDLTSLLQLLDVFLNRYFKIGVRKRWLEWMAGGMHEFMPTGRQRKPLVELICSWILQAWNEIPAEIVSASFLKCGIMYKLDGSKEDLVYTSAEDTYKLDNSSIEELFQSDSESEFEGYMYVV